MASKFKDQRGREWTVLITGETISEAARAGIDFDIAEMIDAAQSGEPLRLASFKFLGQVIDLCWLGCRHNSRVAANKVTEEEFKSALVGEALLPAVMATVQAIAECFGLKVELQESDPTGGGEPKASPSTSAGPNGAG